MTLRELLGVFPGWIQIRVHSDENSYDVSSVAGVFISDAYQNLRVRCVIPIDSYMLEIIVDEGHFCTDGEQKKDNEVGHGHWIVTGRRTAHRTEVKCSVCGASFMIPPMELEWLKDTEKFCCRCGSRMDGGKEYGKIH